MSSRLWSGLPTLLAAALAASAVCGTATGCASSKCGQVTITAIHGGTTATGGGCGTLGVPESQADQAVYLFQVKIHVGEKLEFRYADKGFTPAHGASVSDADVLEVEQAPTSGQSIVTVSGKGVGTSFVLVGPTTACSGGAKEPCVIASVTVAAG